MAEIKHDFTSGKMNKDLDERLVKNGEYRDAMNIQVRTTDGGGDGVGDAGVVQNLQGNSIVGTSMGNELIAGYTDADFVCVGSIVDEKSDNAYFLFTKSGSLTGIKIDTIIQQNIITGQTTPVVVDKWFVATTTVGMGWGAISGSTPYNTLPISTVAASEITPQISISDLRVNMEIFVGISGSQNFKGKIKSIDSATSTITLYDYSSINLTTNNSKVIFKHDRVLNFHKDVRITGINIIDDLLIFTDGVHEPKKINITRSIAGTFPTGNVHTYLMATNVLGDLDFAGLLEFDDINTIPSDLLEEHVTVLRPAPKTPPTLELKTRDSGELQFTTPDQSWLLSGNPPVAGDMIFLGMDENNVSQTSPDLIETNFIANDTLTVAQEEVEVGENGIYFKVKFITYVTTDGSNTAVLTSTSKIQVQIITTLPEMGDDDIEWLLQVELDKPRFELKFPRFGYRYKYEDGEYSAFSPWSELAFDPGIFNYDSTKGYNLGMVNTIQSLVVKDFIPYYTDRALDIMGVDILYKSTESANVYTIKSIRKEIDPEWELFSPGVFASDGVNSIETGRLEITSEAIHRVLPSNQILRTFDNVPRYAKAQEITGSRVVYGNYTQGYDIEFPVGLTQTIYSEQVSAQPKRSVKSIRDYKLGMVFGDQYGRETPVIASSNAWALSDGTYMASTGDVSVEKNLCAFANSFTVRQEWSNQLDSGDPSSMPWIDYVKYYVKETSNEYYNLVLDRWYYARNNENIWLSFPSADRNKVDIETYLLLKKSHGEDKAVLEKARYKIIAIENEAPDFIKIDNREMGTIAMSHGESDFSSMFTNPGADPNNNEPNKLTNLSNKSITLKQDEWDGFLDRYGDNLRGTLKARIVGKTMTTTTSPTMTAERNSGKFETVTHHHGIASGGGEKYVIHFKQSFGESANMREKFQNEGLEIGTAGNDLQYFLEFKEEVVENKPDFDGRFFVLVEKDIAIEKNLEKFSGKKTGFTATSSHKIGYIDTQFKNPALNGPYAAGGNGQLWDGTAIAGYVWTTDLNGNLSVNPNMLEDPGAVDEWWGWGHHGSAVGSGLNAASKVNFFAMGCWSALTPTSTNVGVNTGAATRNYWVNHHNFHSSATTPGYQETNSLGRSNPNRLFIDGARAQKYALAEFDEDGTDDNAFWVNDKRYAEFGGEIVDGGVSIFNYKPTALDQGDASSGFGRLAISQQTNNWDEGTSGWDVSDDAFDLMNRLIEEGCYFQFKDDTSNEGSPHVYQTIHRDVNDPSILLSNNSSWSENDGNIKNFAKSNTSGNATNIDIDVKQTYCNDPSTDWLEYGSFGGQNVGMWGNGEPGDGFTFTHPSISGSYDVTDILWPLNSFGGTSPTVVTVGPESDGGNFSIQVGTSSATDDCGSGFQQRRCDSCDNDYFGCLRQSLRFQFRRIDPDTGELTNEGLQPEEWDPRGQAKHDGTIGNIQIEILAKNNEPGSEIIPESDRSVWETEPKEDVGLDIYYEATHAIPMQLKKGNTLAFAPLKSKVNAIRKANGGWAGVDLQSYGFSNDDGGIDTFTDTIVGGAEYTTNESLIKVVNTDSDDAIVNNTHGLGINDYITFTHSSGLRTRSQIKGYYALVSGTYQKQVPTAVTITYDPNVLTDDSTNNNTVTVSNPSAFLMGVNIVFDPGQGDASNVSGVFGKNFGTSIQLTDTSFFDQTASSDLTATFMMPTGFYQIDKDVYQYEVDLGWHNCYSFGNGVESDRIRDDYNAPTIDNGIKVSTTFVDYGQEDKTSGLTYSGLYNATSSVNDLNEFNMGEKISKNINPAYGSIQALKTRQTDLVTFCEDKILKILANKEAVFMADNDPTIIATDRVLGQVTEFKGDYGISKNPESLATDQYRMYFTDTQRGAVLRLSMDGLTPISNVGMKSWFRENLRGATDLLGGFDIVNGEYDLTINKTTTVSFNETSKGWVSFKSFIPQESVSVSGTYLTVKNSGIFRHYVDTFDDAGVVNNRNIFYNQFVDGVNDAPANSSLTVMFNDQPSSVKSFRTINYEGSQARIDQYLDDDGNIGNDGEYYNIFPNKLGWWVTDFHTDLQNGKVYWFVDKENKWFNNICGTATTLDNLDTAEFTVQGIGTQIATPTIPVPSSVDEDSTVPPSTYTLTIQND